MLAAKNSSGQMDAQLLAAATSAGPALLLAEQSVAAVPIGS
jgi:hypothetical protein